jgi:Tfp pilus assembly protein PilO
VALFGISLDGKSPQYGLALGAFLGAALAGAGYWQLAMPKQQEIKRQKAELRRLEDKRDEARAAAQSLPQFREEVGRLEFELKKLLRILPAKRNTQELLRKVRSLAEQGDFALNVFREGNEQKKEFYSEWPIDIALEGSYHNLALFFDKISRFPRILNIDKLTITAMPQQTDSRSIQAAFVAKTFFYNEEEEGAEAAAGQDRTAAGAAGEVGRAVGSAKRQRGSARKAGDV